MIKEPNMVKIKMVKKFVYTISGCFILGFCFCVLFSMNRSDVDIVSAVILREKMGTLTNSFVNITDVSKHSERKLLVSPSTTERPLVKYVNPIVHCDAKIKNVAFLKVHKAGSTTVMNIMLRFLVENDLNAVLPNRGFGAGFNYLGYGKTVNPETIVPIPANETYNILCNHVVYNHNAFRTVMPTNSVYIGIIREPTSHFISAALYYGFYKHLLNRISDKSTIRHPTEVFHAFFSNISSYRRIPTYFVRNRMSFDFGLPPNRFVDVNYIDNFVENLKKDFKLIMIMERFTESLILMKRYLCWDLKDILYVPLNINKAKSKNPVQLYPVDKQVLRKWNYADYTLYDKMLPVFEQQVRAEGPNFQTEVTYFTKLQKKVQEYCKNLHKYKGVELFVEESSWNSNFIVNEIDCKQMMINEIAMMKVLIINAQDKYLHWQNQQNKPKHK